MMADGFEVKVNGIEMSMPHEEVVAHDILELAEKRGAIPGKPEDYDLQGDKGRYGWDDMVNLSEDSVFITLRKGPTPVA